MLVIRSNLLLRTRRWLSVSLVLSCLLVGTASPVLGAAPSNDKISTPYVLSPSTLTGGSGFNTTEATFAGEPSPTCQTAVGRTIWYRYRPDFGMKVSLNTEGSSFDTVLAVYKSTADGLSPLVCSDDIGGGNTRSSVFFTASQGVAYYVQVGGFAGVGGTGVLNYTYTAANEFWSGAEPIKPGYTNRLNNAWATASSFEPSPTCVSIKNTVWYRVKLAKTRTVSFDTYGSATDTAVAVYRGTTVSGLTEVACADDTEGTNGNASATWIAQKNKTYYIQVGTYANAPAPGYGELRVNFVRLP